MKKCPRCHEPVKKSDQYCPHCGQNLKQPFQFMKWLRIIFIISFFVIPFLYYFLLEDLSMGSSLLSKDNQYVLEKIEDRDIQNVLYEFDSLEDFEKGVKDVSSYVNKIKTYENEIQKQLGTYTTKDYHIYIYDNQEIAFILNYHFTLDNAVDIDVCRKMTRSEQVNDVEYTYTQKGIKGLKEISIDDENLLSLIHDDQSINALYQKLLKREDEFNKKIENIGHFGFGEYFKDDKKNVSLVVYPNQHDFKAVLKYKKNIS